MDDVHPVSANGGEAYLITVIINIMSGAGTSTRGSVLTPKSLFNILQSSSL